MLLTHHGFSDLTSWKKSFWTLSKRPWRSGALNTGAPRWNEVLQGSCTPTWFYSSAPQSTGQLATSRSRAALRTPALTTYSTKACAGKKIQQPVDRSFFYVWADEEGTERNESGQPCVAGNYQPVWTKARSRYPVLAKWCDALWRQR